VAYGYSYCFDLIGQDSISSKKNQIEKDPFFSDTEFYESNMPSDISLNHDNYLYGEKS
jgi:hypothetical protein